MGFDWQVALANLVNFLIIFFILKRLFFKPIKKTITDRQNKIQKGLEDAQRAETELMMAKQKYNEIVSDAKVESRDILKEASEKRDEVVSKAKFLAEEEAGKVKEEALKEIETLKKKEMEEFKKKSSDLVISSVENLLKETVDKGRAEKIISEVLQS